MMPFDHGRAFGIYGNGFENKQNSGKKSNFNPTQQPSVFTDAMDRVRLIGQKSKKSSLCQIIL